MGMRYRPPLLLSPPPTVHVTSYQNFENFQTWKARVKLNEGFLRNLKDLDRDVDNFYDLSAKYEELNKNRGN